MPESRTPSVRARQLARELRELRVVTGLTGEQVATELGWSAAKVSRIETARTAVTVADLKRLLSLYEASAEHGDRLVGLARTARERGWWEVFGSGLTGDYITFIGMEADASMMRSFRTGMINGLLQTKRYAAAIIEHEVPVLPPGETERRVQARLKRQDRLYGPEPLHLWTVLDEGILRRRVGDADVMREQLKHLLDVGSRDNITVQVLPFDAGAHPALAVHFNILSFPGAVLPDVVHVEAMTGDLFVEGEKQVFKYMLAFDAVRRKALPERESMELISSISAALFSS